MTQLYNLNIMLEMENINYILCKYVSVWEDRQTERGEREEGELHLLPTIAASETNYKFCDADCRLFIDLLMISFQIGENVIHGFRISCNLTLLPLPFPFLSCPAHTRTFLSFLLPSCTHTHFLIISSPVLHTYVPSYHFLTRSAHARTSST